jgi:hypothetical protein
MDGQLRAVVTPEIKAEPQPANPKPVFKAAVGMSRKWDAREAGREVARITLEKLGCDPDFILLFSTIHYEKHGGFKEFLAGVWDVLPKDTPLIGGTVAGFINPEGCYTRGATALAVNYPNMDVAVGIGKNTKKAPRLAAKECANQIYRGLSKSKFKNPFLLNIISAGVVPQFPFMQPKRIYNGYYKPFLIDIFVKFLALFQRGVGREEEVQDGLSKELKKYTMLSGSSLDDMKILRNYQFYGNKVFTNSVVSLGWKSDLNCTANATYWATKKLVKFEVTKLGNDGRTIHEINGKPAAQELLRLLDWPRDYLTERVYSKIFYYPIAFEESGHLVPEVLGIFIDESLIGTYMMKNKEMYILSTSGREILHSVEDNLKAYAGKGLDLCIISSCATRLETLGSKSYTTFDTILKVMGKKPFLLFNVGGEGAYSPDKGLFYGNEMFNSAGFWSSETTSSTP